MLETGRVRRITRDRYVYTFVPHDSHAFAHVIGSITFYFGTFTFGISYFTNYLQLARIIVELCLNVGKSVDTRNDLSGIFTQTVQNTTQRFLAHFIGLSGNFDSALGCG